MIAVPIHRRALLPAASLALLLALAACGADDARTDASRTDAAVPALPDAGDDSADAAPVCAFTAGAAPAPGAATTFPCALAPEAAPWADCPAQFPASADAVALLCRHPFKTAPQPAAAVAAPDAVLAGTCAEEKVVVLNISPGHGIECHYATAGALAGVAYYDDANSFCDSRSAAIAAGMVTHAPCLLDMDATWDSLSCDSAPPPSPVCGDAAAP
jgi:hypothetical protein